MTQVVSRVLMNILQKVCECEKKTVTVMLNDIQMEEEPDSGVVSYMALTSTSYLHDAGT